MFSVKLAEFERTDTLSVEHRIAKDDDLWNGVDPGFGGPVDVELTLSATASGQVVAHGRWTAQLASPCRRCLEPVEREVSGPLDIVWSHPDLLEDSRGEESDEDEIRTLDPGVDELDVGEAVREEVLLAFPVYVLCDEGCKGICPQCGTNRNEHECDCTSDESDSRWDPLRELQNERGD